MSNAEIKLKVMEAVQDDVNKGIVKVDSSYMKQIGVNPGDIVEIKGERITAAVVDRAYPGDIGLNIVRMDGNIRRNAKTSIGELVTVKKAEVKAAVKVSIAPASKGVMIKAPPQLIKQGLLGKAAVKGDIISLGRGRRRMYRSGEEIGDIFSMMENQFAGFGFGDLKFIITDTNPRKEVVVITNDTEIEFNPQAVELKEEEGISLGVNYEDIGGLKEEIKKVREMVELPLKHPEIFEKLGIEAPKGVLLHGPPGTGKTLLAKAVASETNSHFIVINGPEIISKFYGESEKNLREKFDEAEKNAPSIIFFDEIDAIATKREESRGDVEKRVVAQLLGLMDGLKSRGKVIVLAATNIPNSLDIALRRPGRFDREIEIGVPDKQGRLDILKIHTRNMPYDADLETEEIIPTLNNELKKSYKQKTEELDLIENEIIQLDKSMQEDKRESVQKLELFQKLEKLRQQQKSISELLPKITNLKESLENQKKSNVIADEIKKIHDFIFESRRKENKSLDELWSNQLENLPKPTKEFIGKIYEVFGERIKNPNSDLYRIIKRNPNLLEKEKKDITNILHGFVGADLSALAKEAAMNVLRIFLPKIKSVNLKEGEQISEELLNDITITKKDFVDALKFVRPSAMREVLVETPDVSWADVGGLEETKEKLKEAVEWPLNKPEVFKRMGIRPPRGILLYGPPGTGKTLLAKAVAKESEANFILINGPSLLSKWVGDSEKAMREVFRKARQTSPTILFFDEIDALVPRRGAGNDSGRVNDKMVNQMLTEMDGLEALNDVVIIGATNRPDIVDPALLRSGRFDRIIYIPIPETDARKNIFEIYLKEMPVVKGIDINKLAELTEGYVGADIEGVCREAAMIALREDIRVKEVKMEHFKKALDVVKPSVNKEVEDAYQELENYFSSARAKQIKEKIEKAEYLG